MRLLHSGDGRPSTELSLDGLVELYRWRQIARAATVRSNFVSTLDGSVQGLDGRSRSINTESDHVIFALHRALADVVLVGAGTVRSEGYRAVDLKPWQRSLRSAEGLAPYPTLAVITRSMRLEPGLVDPPYEHGPVLVVTSGGPDPEAARPFRDAGAEVLQVSGVSVELPALLTELSGRGLTRILCEGGPLLHRELLAHGLLDELSLTLAPSAVGGVGHRSTGGAALAARVDFDLQFVLLAEDQTVFTSYRRRSD